MTTVTADHRPFIGLSCICPYEVFEQQSAPMTVIRELEERQRLSEQDMFHLWAYVREMLGGIGYRP